MKTRECKYGLACKFDHPYGVLLPQKMGVPNCTNYMDSGECKFGTTCRYNHPVMSTFQFLSTRLFLVHHVFD